MPDVRAFLVAKLGRDVVAQTLFTTDLREEVNELADAINRIMGLYNKLQHREEVKILPNDAGLNVIRYQGVLNVRDSRTP